VCPTQVRATADVNSGCCSLVENHLERRTSRWITGTIRRTIGGPWPGLLYFICNDSCSAAPLLHAKGTEQTTLLNTQLSMRLPEIQVV
jgi:hypothetical protein